LDALFAAYAECYDQHDSQIRRRENLVLAIHGFGGLSPDQLRTRMGSSSARSRAAGASLVGITGDLPEELIPVLGGLLSDENDSVRFHALASLGRYRKLPPPGIAEVVAHLQKGLDDPKAHVRSFTAMMLSNWGGDASPVIPRLVELATIERTKTNGVRDPGFLKALHSIDPKEAEKLEAND
jgi:hypothetical protein